MRMAKRAPDPEAWGISARYDDDRGRPRRAPDETVQALLRAMGADDERPPAVPDLRVEIAGRPLDLGRGVLRAEDGTTREVHGLLEGAPPGYYGFEDERGRRTRLIVSPGRCHLPPALRSWAWAVQVYALRSHLSWGVGDLSDLRSFAVLAADQGAGLVMTNPLHAPAPVTPVQRSPYFPTSRCFRNPLYLRIEEVPGAGGERIEFLAAAGRAMVADRHLDHDAVLRLKVRALEDLWSRFPGDARFDAYVAEQGPTLARFATYCALAETIGPDWRRWPEALRRPEAPAVARFAEQQRHRVRFHAWIQWLLDVQVAAVADTLELMPDLAIGVDPGGADACLWQDVFAGGVRVGAPPDEYNTRGQDWGLPPFDPWKLRQAHYAPLIETLRASFRHAGGLRVDHVMGLFRLFWIPEGGSPEAGAYVRYPWEELVAVLALESWRAQALVVGEDLGTVEPWVRDALRERDVLSYRVLWFEPDPRQYPRRAFAALTTHDLPTVAGLWSGADLRAQEARGMRPNVEGTHALRERIRRLAHLPDDTPPGDIAAALCARLADTPACLVSAVLEDALEVEERPNYPGTTGGTNWSLALPLTLDEIARDPRVHRIAALLRER
jgi:4-alpha-glucanotransferase